jgi:hypothetical protein
MNCGGDQENYGTKKNEYRKKGTKNTKKVVDSATQMSALLKTGLRFSRNKS